MSVIQILDSRIVNQIAAGEVVEDSVSVVKELVENALDSGAVRIEIETVGGGQGLIVVRDDGCGMSHEDVKMSVIPHATSKIREFDDLYALETLGFRGEALASISAVSRMTVCSSYDDSQEGLLLEVAGGIVTKSSLVSRKRGTSVEVASLFYNIPVRRHFQKTELSNRNKLRKLIETMILTTTGIGWKWISEGREELFIEPEVDFDGRLSYIFGDEFIKESYVVSASRGPLALSGRVGHPSYHKPNKQGQKWFLNGRTVECPFLSRRVADAFSSFLPQQRYPAFVLYLTLPHGWYDVNVHPQKKEIRLKQEYLVGNFIYESVSNLICADGVIATPNLNNLTFLEHSKSWGADKKNRDSFKFNRHPFDWIDLENRIERFSEKKSLEDHEESVFDKTKPSFSLPYFSLDDQISSEPFIAGLECVSDDGSLPEKQRLMTFLSDVSCIAKEGPFLIAQDGEGLYLVHLRRARKQILFNFKSDASFEKNNSLDKELLLQPIKINLSPEEIEAFHYQRDVLGSLGFSVNCKMANEIEITGFPNFISENEVSEFVKIFLNYMFFDAGSDEMSDFLFRKIGRFREGKIFGEDSDVLKRLWAIGKPEVGFDGLMIYKTLTENALNKVFTNECG